MPFAPCNLATVRGFPISLRLLVLVPALLIPVDSSVRTADWPSPVSPGPTREAPIPAGRTYGRLPIRFEPNVGQAAPELAFTAHAGGYRIGLSERGIRMTRSAAADGAALNLSLDGSAPNPTLSPAGRQASISHYLMGNDPARWHRNVANYAAVRYQQVYPGIDWVIYGNPQQLEYDLVVAPQADPQHIRLKIDGATRLAVDRHGDLLIATGDRTLRQLRPVVYQVGDRGQRVAVDADYRLDADTSEVAFSIGAYDRARELVIDPVLAYSTYQGGSGDDVALAIAVDGAGSAYIAGYTTSSDFPTQQALQGKSAGGTAADSVCSCDAFIAKLTADGTGLVYSTYLGGSQDDYAQAIAVDSQGNAYVAGYTGSTDFPTSAAEQGSNAGGSDAFVVKLSADGSTLDYATYLGGTQADVAQAIAVDGSGSAYVAGFTYSTNFPTAPSTTTLPGLPPSSSAEQSANAGGYDAFVAKFSSDGSTLQYATYLGGSGDDYAYGIAVDASGSAYVAGDTTSTDFPTASAEQPAEQDNYDAFVTKFSADGTTLAYSTYLGGHENDHAKAIAVGSDGSAYVAGATVSTNFPTAGAVQASSSGNYDAFVTKFSADGSALVYSTYLGGTDDDDAQSIAVDGSGTVWVAGYTASSNFPLLSPLQCTYGGGASDAFVAQINPAGNALIEATYLGGDGDDLADAIAVDGSGAAYVAGSTTSTAFPTARARQAANGGGTDAFIAKLASGTPASCTSTAGAPPTTTGAGSTTGSSSSTAATTAAPSGNSAAALSAWWVALLGLAAAARQARLRRAIVVPPAGGTAGRR